MNVTKVSLRFARKSCLSHSEYPRLSGVPGHRFNSGQEGAVMGSDIPHAEQLPSKNISLRSAKSKFTVNTKAYKWIANNSEHISCRIA